MPLVKDRTSTKAVEQHHRHWKTLRRAEPAQRSQKIRPPQRQPDWAVQAPNQRKGPFPGKLFFLSTLSVHDADLLIIDSLHEAQWNNESRC